MWQAWHDVEQKAAGGRAWSSLALDDDGRQHVLALQGVHVAQQVQQVRGRDRHLAGPVGQVQQAHGASHCVALLGTVTAFE